MRYQVGGPTTAQMMAMFPVTVKMQIRISEKEDDLKFSGTRKAQQDKLCHSGYFRELIHGLRLWREDRQTTHFIAKAFEIFLRAGSLIRSGKYYLKYSKTYLG